MAIHLTKHTDLSVLAGAFAAELRQRPSGLLPLEAEYLIVQTPGMRKWLALETARRNGSFALMETLTPVQFIMKLGFLVLRQREERTIFEKDILPWALFRLLERDIAANAPAVRRLREWLDAGSEDRPVRLFALARNVADLFDQYMLSRGELLAAWEQGRRLYPAQPEEEWQAHLWRGLLAGGADGLSRADYFDRLKAGLAGAAGPGLLPPRIFLFGMSLLPRRFLEIFDQLSGQVAVHLYLQVPSLFYYGDLNSEQTLRRRKRQGVDTAGLGMEAGNRLLANFGATGRDFMDQILQTGFTEQEGGLDAYDLPDPDPATGAGLLHWLQHDIRLCRESRPEPQALAESGWTLRLARCPGALREVEVLRDLLLECFSADPSLAPSDVLVVSTDLAIHAPLIDLVFGAENPALPFGVADAPGIAENRTMRLVLDLLDAVGGRFTPAGLVPLFEEACELCAEPLALAERDTLAAWCRDAGIRWGRDGASKAALGLPPDPGLTWAAGLDRLFAAYAIAGDEPLDDGLFPGGGAPAGNAGLLGRFAAFIEILGSLAGATGEAHTLAEWVALTRPPLNRLLAAGNADTGEDGTALSPLAKALGSLAECLDLAGMAGAAIPWSLFVRHLADTLGEPGQTGSFLSGSITVAGMIPMRSLPFRIIAVLGLNQGRFPRFTLRPDYDLMRLEKRPGDRDTLEADRYVFLEMLLSAADRLILLSGGLDETGKPAPLSSAVEQLLAYLDREFLLDGKKAGEAICLNYPLQPYSGRYLDPGEDPRLRSFNRGWFESGPAVPRAAALRDWRVGVGAGADEAASGRIDGREILKALNDPLAWFLRMGCGLRTAAAGAGELPDSELFRLDNLAEWQLRDSLCGQLRPGGEHALGRLAASGGLPPGRAGGIAVERERRKIASRLQRVRSLAGCAEPVFGTEYFRARTAGALYSFEAELCPLQAADGQAPGFILLDPGRLKAKRVLKAWLTHLSANFDQPRSTWLVTLDKTLHFRGFGDRGRSGGELQVLWSLARECRQRLVPFFPDAAWAYCQCDSPEAGISAAWRCLEPDLGLAYGSEDQADPWLQKAFQGAGSLAEAGMEAEFTELATRVFAPVMAAMEAVP